MTKCKNKKQMQFLLVEDLKYVLSMKKEEQEEENRKMRTKFEDSQH